MENVKPIEKLSLKEMMLDFHNYYGLPEGLVQLPLPDKFKIGNHRFTIPKYVDEFARNICYGQRIFFSQKEENDFGLIVRVIDGYYYPLYKNNKWDEDKALLFGKLVLNCTVNEIYPVAMHLVNLISELVEKEKNILYKRDNCPVAFSVSLFSKGQHLEHRPAAFIFFRVAYSTS